ncbi:MAG: SprT family zinc-dependent metalloprotease [Pelistega sp.]|nr:SprT family zinc-dependent metalloprotease [Pelistega sp.]
MSNLSTISTSVGFFEYALRYSKRRTLNLKVTSEAIQVNAPWHTPTSTIESFIKQHAEWIQKTRTRLASQAVQPINHWQLGQTIQYLGQSITLAADPTAIAPCYQGNYQEPCGSDQLILPIALDADSALIKQHAQFWLESRAQQWFTERLAWFAEHKQIHPNAWRISRARTRWGQCNSRGVISLNWRLIHFPHEQIDYVIAHELAHLRQMNHSPKFWAEVAHLMPNYETIKMALRTHRIEACD